jgi:D-glycero-D-manno-heptose 1,7-bisphosphate phosphatase
MGIRLLTGTLVRAVFLDRDGVLNRAVVRDGRPCPPASTSELEILPAVDEALLKLKEAGFMTIVVTNQPDVARGTQTRTAVEEINTFLMDRLAIDAIMICYHDDQDACRCRKPLPGLLLMAAAKYGIDLGASFMVGDRWRDVEAGNGAGCRTILIDYAYGERAPSSPPDLRVASLLEAAIWIIQQSTPRKCWGTS